MSIPISEDLSARLAFSNLDRDGWVRQCIGGSVDGSDCTSRQNLNDINYSTWRASFLWEPTDRLSMLMVYDHFVSDQNGTPGFIVDVQPGNPFAPLSPEDQAALDFLEGLIGDITPIPGVPWPINCSGLPDLGIDATGGGLADCLYFNRPSAAEAQTRDSLKRSHPRIASQRRQESLVRHYGVALTTTYDFEDFVSKLILSTRKVNAETDFDLDGTSDGSF